MFHSCNRFLAGDNSRFKDEPLYFFARHGHLGVVLFFIISGYCITAAAYGALTNGKPLSRYAYDRVRRIYPPYLAALIVGVVNILLIGHASAHRWIGPVHHLQTLSLSPRFWIGNLFIVQRELHTGLVNGVFWSLCYEVTFYIVVGVLLWVAKLVAVRSGVANGTLTFICGLTLTTSLSLLSLIVYGNAIFPFDLWHQFALGGVLFFLIESNANTIPDYSPRLRWILNCTAGLLVLFTVFYVVRHGLGESHDENSGWRSIFCLIFCLLLAALRRVDLRLTASRFMRPFFVLGAFSYSLYLIHPVFIPYVDLLSRKAGLDGSSYWLAFWIQFFVALASGYIFYQLVERRFVSHKHITQTEL
jgi:peptidoglycan/LPS O-acetylase OafA/YrhL